MNVGFIGTGSMGAAMVPNLVAAGHRVSVWNRNAAAAEALAGVTVLTSPAEAFGNDAVVTMLSDDTAVRDVIINSTALAAARQGCVHAVMSTISPALVGELEQLHRIAGVGYVSAPVFGVPTVAAQAQLHIMAAGDPAAISAVQPLFDAMSRKTWFLGDDPKHASVAKIAGNMMLSMAIEAMGEAVALTESYGLKARDFLDVLTSTIFTSPSYIRYGAKIADGNFVPGFSLTLGLKDVNLALEAAAARQAAMPAVEIVRENMLAAIEAGLGSKDWSIFSEITRRRTEKP